MDDDDDGEERRLIDLRLASPQVKMHCKILETNLKHCLDRITCLCHEDLSSCFWEEIQPLSEGFWKNSSPRTSKICPWPRATLYGLGQILEVLGLDFFQNPSDRGWISSQNRPQNAAEIVAK